MAFDIRDDDEDHHPDDDEFEEYDDVKQAPPPKFYRRRKFWIFCIPNLIISTIVAVLLGLYVIMPKIAQSLMNNAKISFNSIVSERYMSTRKSIVSMLAVTDQLFIHVSLGFVFRTSPTPRPRQCNLSWSET
jgi:hypothetical protein